MSRYTHTTPGQQGVRLRDWGPGRLNQLRLFLGHLEKAVNNSLAAQVEQSPKRKFSSFVPIIPAGDINGAVEFRELRVSFDPPVGLKGLLFYEYQLSETQGFAQFETFTSPEPSYVFSDLEDESSYYFRIRIITKGGFVGPFSDVFQADTPAAKAQGLYDATATNKNITTNVLTEIFSITYTAIGGKAYYSVEYEMQPIIDRTDPNLTTNWADIEFRWTVDDAQVGQDMLVTVYAGSQYAGIGQRPLPLLFKGDLVAITGEFGGVLDISDVNKRLTVPGPYTVIRRGSLIQKFSNLDAGNRSIKLLARILPAGVHPTGNDYQVSTGVAIDYTGGASIEIKNFEVFEANVEI